MAQAAELQQQPPVEAEEAEDAAVVALTRAVQEDNVVEARRLLDHRPSLLHEVGAGPGSRTLLMLACAGSASTAMVQLLLSRGACLEKTSVCGWSPLRWACAGGRADLAALLLQRGARPAVRDFNGWTSLMHASACGHLEVVRLLVHHLGGQCERPNYRGETSLHRACLNGHAHVAALLLRTGAADPSMVNRDGKTAKQVALDKGHAQCVQAIESYEGDVSRRWLLAKVRAMIEASETLTTHSSQQQREGAAAPAYLRGRVERGEALPTVLVAEDEEGSRRPDGGDMKKKKRGLGGEGQGKGKKARAAAASGGCPVLAWEVARWSLWGLNNDLFVELDQLLTPHHIDTTTTH